MDKQQQDGGNKNETLNKTKEYDLITKLLNSIEIDNSENSVTILFKRNYNGWLISRLESFMLMNCRMFLDKPNMIKNIDSVKDDIYHILKQITYYENGGYLTDKFFIINVSKDGFISFLLNFLYVTYNKKNSDKIDDFIENSRLISIFLLDKVLNREIDRTIMKKYLNVE